MSNTYSRMFFHCIWGTKNRYPSLLPIFDKEVHALIKNHIEKKGGKVLAIGGSIDHVHVLISMKPTTLMSDLIQQAKGGTTRIIRELFTDKKHFFWQRGSGIFSIRYSDVNVVSKYIQNQATHHKNKSFNGTA